MGYERVDRLRSHDGTPSNILGLQERLAKAERQEGETLFDMIVSIIRDHGTGGSEADDGVQLILEE